MIKPNSGCYSLVFRRDLCFRLCGRHSGWPGSPGFSRGVVFDDPPVPEARPERKAGTVSRMSLGFSSSSHCRGYPCRHPPPPVDCRRPCVRLGLKAPDGPFAALPSDYRMSLVFY